MKRPLWIGLAITLMLAGHMAIPALVEAAASSLAGVAEVPIPSHPAGIAIDTSNNRIYVTKAFGSAVAVLDGATNAVLAEIPVGFHPTAVAVNPTNHLVYVAHTAGNVVYVIDGTSNAVVGGIGAAFSPSSVAVNPITNRVYATLSNSHLVAVFDPLLTGVGVNYIPVAFPTAVAVNPATNKVYVATGCCAGLTVIDGATETVTAEVTVGSFAIGVAVDHSLNRIYVANLASNTVSVVDGAQNILVATVGGVGDGPFAIATDPIAHRVYVTSLFSNDLVVIDGETNALSTSFPTFPLLPGEHAGVAVNPVLSRVYASNSDAGVVTVTDDVPTPLATIDAWFILGLKNSDDIGTRFDILAQVFRNGAQIGQNLLKGVNGGSSGFAGASFRSVTIPLVKGVSVVAGDTLSVKFSVRIAEGLPGHRSGTARLWYGDAMANTGFGATPDVYFLTGANGLSTSPGSGPRQTRDVLVDRLRGNPFKPFGTWSKTFPAGPG